MLARFVVAVAAIERALVELCGAIERKRLHRALGGERGLIGGRFALACRIEAAREQLRIRVARREQRAYELRRQEPRLVRVERAHDALADLVVIALEQARTARV